MKFLLDTDRISILQKHSGPEYVALMTRIARVRRGDLVLCIVSFHEQVLGCNTYVAQAKSAADLVRGYRMFDRVLSAFAAAPCCHSIVTLLPFATAWLRNVCELQRWICGSHPLP